MEFEMARRRVAADAAAQPCVAASALFARPAAGGHLRRLTAHVRRDPRGSGALLGEGPGLASLDSGLPSGRTWASISAGHMHTCGVTRELVIYAYTRSRNPRKIDTLPVHLELDLAVGGALLLTWAVLGLI